MVVRNYTLSHYLTELGFYGMNTTVSIFINTKSWMWLPKIYSFILVERCKCKTALSFNSLHHKECLLSLACPLPTFPAAFIPVISEGNLFFHWLPFWLPFSTGWRGVRQSMRSAMSVIICLYLNLSRTKLAVCKPLTDQVQDVLEERDKTQRRERALLNTSLLFPPYLAGCPKCSTFLHKSTYHNDIQYIMLINTLLC